MEPLEGADGIVVVTECKQEFRNPNFEVMKQLLAAACDLRWQKHLRSKAKWSHLGSLTMALVVGEV